MPKNYTNRSGKGKKKQLNTTRVVQWTLVVVLFAALIFVLSQLLKDAPSGGSDVNQTNPPTATQDQLAGSRFAADTMVNGVSIGKMTADEARAALAQSVNTQVEGYSVTLTYGESSWVMDESAVPFSSDLEAVLSDAMQNGPGAYNTSVTADRDAIAAYVQTLAAEIDKNPVEPQMIYDRENASGSLPFTIKDGAPGLKVNVDATVSAVLAQLSSESFGSVAVATQETPPSASAAELSSKVAKIGSFTTEFSTREAGRTHNVQLAAEKLNGVAVANGETFSFNDIVGPRDKANGWKEANVIVGGNRYEEGWGGGICQVSTTLYNSLLLTGMDFSDFARVNHSLPSGYVERGLDATVAYGSKDFKFTNTTGSTVYIVAYTSDMDAKTGKLTFEIYGNELPNKTQVKVHSKTVETLDPEAPELIFDPTEPTTYKKELIKERKGYVVEVYREIIINGQSQGEELLYRDTYKPVRGVYNVGSASSQPDNSGGDYDIPEENVDIPEIP